MAEAVTARCMSYAILERAREDEANAARYATMRIPTEQEEREAEEERLVAANEGRHISATFATPLEMDILKARKAVAARRAARSEAA